MAPYEERGETLRITLARQDRDGSGTTREGGFNVPGRNGDQRPSEGGLKPPTGLRRRSWSPPGVLMKILPLLCLALVLAACGEPDAGTPPTGPAGASGPPAAPVSRAVPLAVGDDAPAFAGLPAEGKTIVVFYRGPW